MLIYSFVCFFSFLCFFSLELARRCAKHRATYRHEQKRRHVDARRSASPLSPPQRSQAEEAKVEAWTPVHNLAQRVEAQGWSVSSSARDDASRRGSRSAAADTAAGAAALLAASSAPTVAIDEYVGSLFPSERAEEEEAVAAAADAPGAPVGAPGAVSPGEARRRSALRRSVRAASMRRELPLLVGLPRRGRDSLNGELSFIYRYISRESRSQFDSLPLTSSINTLQGCPTRFLESPSPEMILSDLCIGRADAHAIASGALIVDLDADAIARNVRHVLVPPRRGGRSGRTSRAASRRGSRTGVAAGRWRCVPPSEAPRAILRSAVRATPPHRALASGLVSSLRLTHRESPAGRSSPARSVLPPLRAARCIGRTSPAGASAPDADRPGSESEYDIDVDVSGDGVSGSRANSPFAAAAASPLSGRISPLARVAPSPSVDAASGGGSGGVGTPSASAGRNGKRRGEKEKSAKHFGSARPRPAAPPSTFDQLEADVRCAVFPARGARGEHAFGSCSSLNRAVWGRVGRAARAPRRQWHPLGGDGGRGAFVEIDALALLAEEMNAAFRRAVEELLAPLGTCAVPLYDVDDTRAWPARSGVLIYRRRYLHCLCAASSKVGAGLPVDGAARWARHMEQVRAHLRDAGVRRAPSALRPNLTTAARRQRVSESAAALGKSGSAAVAAVAQSASAAATSPRRRGSSSIGVGDATVRLPRSHSPLARTHARPLRPERVHAQRRALRAYVFVLSPPPLPPPPHRPPFLQSVRGYDVGAAFVAEMLRSAAFKSYVTESATGRHPRVPILG